MWIAPAVSVPSIATLACRSGQGAKPGRTRSRIWDERSHVHARVSPIVLEQRLWLFPASVHAPGSESIVEWRRVGDESRVGTWLRQRQPFRHCLSQTVRSRRVSKRRASSIAKLEDFKFASASRIFGCICAGIASPFCSRYLASSARILGVCSQWASKMVGMHANNLCSTLGSPTLSVENPMNTLRPATSCGSRAATTSR